MASGWNLWIWLPCIGVVSGCFLRRYIDILTIIGERSRPPLSVELSEFSLYL